MVSHASHCVIAGDVGRQQRAVGMTPRLAIVGAGGHGRELLHVVRSADSAAERWHIVGIAADSVEDMQLLDELGIAWIGTVEHALELESFDLALVGIGDWQARRAVAERLALAGVQFPAVVHPSAYVGSAVTRGRGSAVWPTAAVSSQTSLGRHAHVNQAASISHDAALGDYVTVAPHATLCGAVAVGTGAWIGAGSCVLEGRSIGAGSVVGAGAVVTRDVAPWTVVAGVPARLVRELRPPADPS